ncbi:transglutaminase domain-containing protein [Microbacteriaceae bacterium VKM Ac-2854]|nr:transglutaminase domain-containing protein [Microbacteriaceae bacterium VKM Ac-2854]
MSAATAPATHRDGDPRAGSWPLSIALWFASVGAISGVGRLLVGIDWLVTAAVAAAIVLAVPALARSLRAHPVVPPVLGLTTAVAAITFLYLPRSSLLLVLPTPGSFAEATAVMEDGFASIAQQGLPAVADTGIAFLLVGGAIALTWIADLFAFTVRVPAATGVLFLALLGVPVAIDPSDVSWLSLIVTSVAYAGVLAAGSALRHAGQRRPRSAPLPALVAVAAVVAVSAGLAGAAPGYVRTPFSSGVSGTLFNGSIDPVVALGNDLRRPNAVTVLEYATAAQDPVYLRVLAIADFDGQNWAPSDPGSGESVGLDAIAAPEGLGDDVARTEESVAVDILTLRSRWLPVPYPLRSVDGLSGSWESSVEDGAVSGSGTTRQGDSYVADALIPDPTDEQLAASDAVGDGFERYLALPDDVPEIVTQTADQVTAGADTPYDRARALQAYFRSSEFTYSEDTPAEEGYDGDGVGVLADFLEVKAGYCVHFASAMAVMAREQGIPARLAIGYQPGTFTSSGDGETSNFRVSSSDLHAWPELYFAGVGWLPFEPTPSRGTPAGYTLPSTDSAAPGTTPSDQASSSTEESAAPEAGVTPTPTATSATTAAAATGTGDGGAAPQLWLLSVLLLLIPAVLRFIQRVRRRRRAQDGAVESTWAELLASARDLGVVIDDGDSPRVIEGELAAAMARRIGPVPLGELAALRAAVERERYAAAPAHGTAKTGFAWIRIEPLVAALRGSANPGERILAAVLPRSVATGAGRRRSVEL